MMPLPERAFTPFAMKTYWTQSFIITVFVFFMLWLGSLVSNMGIFSALDTVSAALKDFRMTDYVFSNLRADPLVDQRIVLVNIGTLDRRGMAQEIQILNSFHPRVIA